MPGFGRRTGAVRAKTSFFSSFSMMANRANARTTSAAASGRSSTSTFVSTSTTVPSGASFTSISRPGWRSLTSWSLAMPSRSRSIFSNVASGKAFLRASAAAAGRADDLPLSFPTIVPSGRTFSFLYHKCLIALAL